MQFNEKKAAQVAAYFLKKEGNEMEIMKLMKLLYLAERKNVERHGELLIGDSPCSMQYGPVLSRSYDLTKPTSRRDEGGWSSWINERQGNYVSLREEGRYDQLSKANLKILEEVWAEFGGFSALELSDYTHDNCKEWRYPGRSSVAIEFSELAEAVGFPPAQAKIIQDRIIEQRFLDSHI